jgi:hypothetical protein
MRGQTSLLHLALMTLAIFATLLNSPAAAQGLLDRARDEVRDQPERLPEPSQDSSDDDDHCDDEGGGWFHYHDHGDGFIHATGLVLTSPWWGPHVMFDAGFGVPGYFPGEPYFADDAGYMIIGRNAAKGEFPATTATRFALEYGHDLDNLQSVTGRVLWEHQMRFGVDGEIRYLQEEGDFLDDELAIGDLNFVYRFVQSERVVMRSGVGINWLIDEHDAEAGFNFTYGGDLFPVRPLVISSEIDWGTLGDAEVFQWRGTVGAVWDHVEVYAGYRYYELEGVALDGLIIGLRTWF